MKKVGFVATLLVLVVCGLLGCSSKKEEPRTDDLQESETLDLMLDRPQVRESLGKLLRAIACGDREYVASHISYPLMIGDGYPMHPIGSEKEMKLLFDKVFDDSLRSVYKAHQDVDDYYWTENMGWHTTYDTSIYFSIGEQDNCYIYSFNYESEWMKQERERLISEELASLHSSLQSDSIIPDLSFKARHKKGTVWYGRIDTPADYNSFHRGGKDYRWRLALYKNGIRKGQKPDNLYYANSTGSGSCGNYTLTFYDEQGHERALFDHVVCGSLETAFGDFLYINKEKDPMECESIYWLDEINR